jgi:hypothetical protein
MKGDKERAKQLGPETKLSHQRLRSPFAHSFLPVSGLPSGQRIKAVRHGHLESLLVVVVANIRFVPCKMPDKSCLGRTETLLT